MTGGFYDHKRSRLKYMSTIKQNKKSIRVKEDELRKIRDSLRDILLGSSHSLLSFSVIFSLSSFNLVKFSSILIYLFLYV